MVMHQKSSNESKVVSFYIIARLLKGLASMALHSTVHLRNTKLPMLMLLLTEYDIMRESIHIDGSNSDSEISGSN